METHFEIASSAVRKALIVGCVLGSWKVTHQENVSLKLLKN